MFIFEKLSILLAATALCIPVVNAFGQTGHFVIGATVQKLLPSTCMNKVAECNYINNVTSRHSLGAASIWADYIKRNPRFRWTSPLHYYDIDNDPPSYCGYINEYPETKKLHLFTGFSRSLKNLTTSECGSFFHFNILLHLLQDLHQPLHLTGKDRGGNEFFFDMDGKKYNLHKYWDFTGLDMMLKEKLGEKYNINDAVDYFYEKSNKTITCKVQTTESTKTALLKLANEISLHNCDLVWNTDDTMYKQKSFTLLEKLILQGIETSYCVLKYVLE